ncbi:107aa long hypothetical protein [Pyrococcus horikoshii OT3]|uniref:Uncharacterized protein n=1 Tax=Pyrococcus horikoshii (strain ATCC 700860 / DSM 12428 / JCM 9974 / NBRC 100139 / OT-3) TaxID=70601 RepID=O73985_PYRHO|nr:107aa long hypothetical protein [Pyrococcus horikoshii OT3]
MKVLTPAALAPTTAEIAECSLSTFMNSASSSPFATNSLIFSGTRVDGVIGNAAITLGFASLAAHAAASLAFITVLIGIKNTPFHLTSLTISIAFVGHSFAHIPQPLQ